MFARKYLNNLMKSKRKKKKKNLWRYVVTLIIIEEVFDNTWDLKKQAVSAYLVLYITVPTEKCANDD